MNALPTNSTTTRLSGHRLTSIRFIAAFLALLMVGVGVASYLIYLSEVGKICTLSEAQCQRQLQFTPNELANFQQSPISFDFAVAFRYSILASSSILACVLGLLIMVRKSDDWMALFVGLFLISLTLGNGGPTSAFARLYPTLAPLMQGLVIVQSSLFILFFMLFPNGRIAPNWMRWTGPLIYAFYLGIILVPNLIEVISQSKIASVFAIGGSISIFGVLMISQIIRYKSYSNFTERQQTRWVVFGIVLYIATQLATIFFIVPFQSGENRWLFFFFGTLGFNASQAILVLAIGFAVLRSRLFDIDILIRRTLQYSILTGLLALTYFGSIVLLQNLFFGAQTSEFAIVLSTLTIAALFNPLRIRIQNFIDRRFYRKKYNAEQALAQFAVTARDEVDMDRLTDALTKVIQETVQPESVRIWVKSVPEKK